MYYKNIRYLLIAAWQYTATLTIAQRICAVSFSYLVSSKILPRFSFTTFIQAITTELSWRLTAI